MTIWKTAKEIVRIAAVVARTAVAFARARFFEGQRDYDSAIDSLSEGLRLYRETWGPLESTYRKRLLHLGFYHRRRGDVATAKEIYQQGLSLSEQAATGPTVETLMGTKLLVHREMWLIGLEEQEAALSPQQIKFLIARCHGELEEWEQAKGILLDLIEHCRSLQSQPDTYTEGTLIYTLAGIYHGAGEYEMAEQRYLESLEFLRQTPDYSKKDEAWVYRELAVLALNEADKEKYARAEDYLKTALNLLTEGEGQDAETRAEVWRDLISLSMRLGDWDKADETAKQSVEDIQTLAGENELVLADHLSIVSRLQMSGGRYASALHFSQQELGIVRGRCESTELRLAKTLANLGAIYGILHRSQESRANYDEALAICLANGEAGSELKAEIEEGFTLLRIQAGEKESGRNLTRTEQTSQTDFADVASIEELESQYFHYLAAGRYKETEEMIRRAFELADKSTNLKERGYILTLAGVALQLLGENERAEAAYLQALKLYDEELGENRQDISLIYDNLVKLYAESGRLAEADAFLRRSAKLIQYLAREDPDAFVKRLTGIGSLYMAIGDPAQAGIYLEQALVCIHEQGLQESLIYGKLITQISLVKLQTGEVAEAEALAVEAMIVLGRYHSPEYATACVAIGVARSITGDLPSSEKAFSDAIQMVEETLGPDHPSTRKYKGFLACLYMAQERYEEADEQFAEVFAPCEGQELGFLPFLPEDFLLRALCFVALGRKDEALKWLMQMAANEDRFIDNAFAFSTEKQRMQVLSRSQVGLHALLALTRDAFTHDLSVRQQVLSIVLRRKALGIEALATQREVSGRHPHLKERLRELSALQQRIAHLLGNPTLEGPLSVAQQIEETERRRSEIEAELAREIPEIRLSDKLKRANCEEVVGALPPNSVLVEFVRQQGLALGIAPALDLFHDAHYLAFVLPAHESAGVKLFDLGEAEEIDRLIHNFQCLITESGQSSARHFFAREPAQDNSRDEELNELGQELCAKLVLPWLEDLSCGQQIFLSPDGELNCLSFEVLPLGSGEFLIDRHMVVYLGSGRDLLRYQSESVPVSEGEIRLLVAAAPDFDLKTSNDEQPDSQLTSGEERASPNVNGKRSGYFRPLHWARREGEAVAQLLGVNALLGAEVSEQRIKKILDESPSPKILHLATHGFFRPPRSDDDETKSPINPFEPAALLLQQKIGDSTQGGMVNVGWSKENPLLRSCLALAGANEKLIQGTDDGFLTALDISGFNLSQTELVVLSACQTGVGDIQNGEGVWGLRRAFELAGAQTLVISLWEVDDQGTQELMEVFYKELLTGETRASSLHKAKLWLRQRPGRTSHPFYWGAFICQGNYKSISGLETLFHTSRNNFK